MNKIFFVFGTRPEAIKMAPLIKLIEKNPQDYECIVCVTAQHRQMLDQVLNLFEIKPNYDLNLMQAGQGLADINASVLKGLTPILIKERPNIVLVHGDTTTAMASAMAAFYEDIPIGHIEAGLRTGNKKSPFPEEMNRTIIGRVADFHFAPTQGARVNLLSEGVLKDHVYVTGNTVIDALHSTLKLLRVNKILQAQLDEKFNYIRSDKKLILVTGHRRESFGIGFENICQALSRIAKREDVEILYPVHLNPNVLRPVHKLLGNASNIHLIEPLDYLPFVYVMNRSHVLLTDSGGIQEEGPSLGKPVLVMRNVTERPEAVTAGTVKLVGTDAECIASNVYRLLDDSKEYLRMSQSHNPYGDGTASSQIFSIIGKIRV